MIWMMFHQLVEEGGCLQWSQVIRQQQCQIEQSRSEIFLQLNCLCTKIASTTMLKKKQKVNINFCQFGYGRANDRGFIFVMHE